MKINAVAQIQDCGDGSMCVSVYNDLNELLANHGAIEDLIDEEASEQEIEAKKQEILTEDDPYENGYIAKHVTIEIDENGKLKPFSISGG